VQICPFTQARILNEARIRSSWQRCWWRARSPGKFAGEGLQNIDEDDDMLSAMARELVERNGIGETADAVWKALNTEHQKMFSAASRSIDDACSIDAAATPPTNHADPAALVEEAIGGDSVLIFGQRPRSLSGRRPRARSTVPEQASLFG